MHPSAPVPASSHFQPIQPWSSPIPSGVTHITLIGHGNVSLDIARLLLTAPQRLSQLDIPQHVLSGLCDTWNTLKHVTVVGRRGPREAQFTTKELREMMRLEDAAMVPISESVLDDAEKGDVYNGQPMTRQETKILKLLREGSHNPITSAQKTFSIEFWSNPAGYTTLPQGARLALEDTRLDPETGRAISSERARNVRTDLLVTSLGYQSDPRVFATVADKRDLGFSVIHGHGAGVGDSRDTDDDKMQWFDLDSGRLRNDHGRVVTSRGRVVRNVYAVGWAARGARGVLAGTVLDANDVAGAVVDDWRINAVREGGSEGEVDVLPRASDVVGGLEGVPEVVERGLYEGNVLEYDAWRRVDEEERRRGRLGGKERERMSWGQVRIFLQEE